MTLVKFGLKEGTEGESGSNTPERTADVQTDVGLKEGIGWYHQGGNTGPESSWSLSIILDYILCHKIILSDAHVVE